MVNKVINYLPKFDYYTMHTWIKANITLYSVNMCNKHVVMKNKS